MWDTHGLPTRGNSGESWVHITPESHLKGAGLAPSQGGGGEVTSLGSDSLAKFLPQPPSGRVHVLPVTTESWADSIRLHRLIVIFVSLSSLTLTSAVLPEELMEWLMSLRSSCEYQSQGRRLYIGKKRSNHLALTSLQVVSQSLLSLLQQQAS